MNRTYSVDRAVDPKRGMDSAKIPVLYVVDCADLHESCSGLRAFGDDSDVKVFDAETKILKRIENAFGFTIDSSPAIETMR